MTFEIQRTQRSLPGTTTGVPFEADVSTGQAQVAGAFGQVAAAGQDTILTLNRLQADNQLSEAKRQMREILDQYEDAIEREPDSSLYPEITKQAQEAMSQVSPSNGLAKRAYGSLLNTTKAGMNNTILDVSLARERDTQRADVALMITKGQFERARKAIKRGVKNGTYSKVEGEALIAESRAGQKTQDRQAFLDDLSAKAIALANSPLGGKTKATAFVRKQTGLSSAERGEVERRLQGAIQEQVEAVKQGQREGLVAIGRTKANVDDALDTILEEGLRIGADKAEITFAQQQVKDDFTRLKAARVEDEAKRVEESQRDLGVRMYADANKTTVEQVNAANLPEEKASTLRNSVRSRDKEILAKKKVVTSTMTQTRINLLLGQVTTGRKRVLEAVAEYQGFQEDVELEQRTDDIVLLFKAEENSKDETKRRNQTILTEQGGKLRDAIERSQGIITIIKDEQREFLVDLANDAVIELNDRFRDLDFTDPDIKAFNDTLMRKYVLSQQAIVRAVSMKNVLAKKTFAKQVDAMVARVKGFKGRPVDQRAMIDEGMRLGLINEDGTPSTETRDPLEDDNTFLDTLLR